MPSQLGQVMHPILKETKDVWFYPLCTQMLQGWAQTPSSLEGMVLCFGGLQPDVCRTLHTYVATWPEKDPSHHGDGCLHYKTGIHGWPHDEPEEGNKGQACKPDSACGPNSGHVQSCSCFILASYPASQPSQSSRRSSRSLLPHTSQKVGSSSPSVPWVFVFSTGI